MHLPVLKKEALEYLDPKPGEKFIDCTFGEGGHAMVILEKISPEGKLLGIDRDPVQISKFKNIDKKRLVLVCGSFADLKEIIKERGFDKADGILMDLGVSSWHLEESERGFSFKKKEPLDMRYDIKDRLTAEKILNFWSKQDIEKILREYGQEPFARKIAESIVSSRKIAPLKNTFQLIEAVREALPGRFLKGKRHFATRTFQALRMAVNGELESLQRALPQALEILAPGGRMAVISFHSLEDRIVKNFFKEKKEFLQILTKKPVVPSFSEIKQNPRARSAKLRAIKKI